ncbi:MAG: type II CRISPR-associated endonuclease Cas1 [Candidatus Zixiibacteriota bacterium]
MEKRVIDLSEEAASLSVHLGQLLIRRPEREDSVPLEDILALIVSHPAVHYTHAVLSGICSSGGIFISCNDRRMPAGMLLPLDGNFVQAERFAIQAGASLPVKKNAWKQIVSAKIRAQGCLLAKLNGGDSGLLRLAAQVQSGDSGNLEALASRRYWPALFDEKFRRVPGADNDINRLLNYGYAILRGIVSRAVCAAGLHPCLGIHHHNRYNSFCLADDLMEPYRPCVDKIVHRLVGDFGPGVDLDRDSKSILISGLMSAKCRVKKEYLSIFESTSRLAGSLLSMLEGKKQKLCVPEFRNDKAKT